FTHPIAQKYLQRSGVAHAVACAFHAYRLAVKAGVSPDLAAKAALLHDIGHYESYTDGNWDYEKYRRNDLHAIKGAERAPKLLIRLGEEPKVAKEIAHANLPHTDSYLTAGQLYKTTPQQILKQADELDEQPGGHHHYRQMDHTTAL
ncbi:HD domain-containing protein, partial [Bacillus amyloliquefaciens]|uniref:HD domain-containing protein n=1 Tax=Bacillus amyloliquefaciens TaxID=1390 RepID=UPI00284B6CC6